MPCSKPSLSPHRVIRQLSLQQVRPLLIELFQTWGIPQAIRTDNGSPLGSPCRTVIPIFSLWLAGWGIRHILNRPRIPTDNPNVENNQATSARWAEVHNCRDLAEVDLKLEEAARFQRDHFQVSRLGGVTRKQLYTRLYDNPRKFDQIEFDHHKAYQLLAQALYPRKASTNGVISLYEKPFSIGAKYRGQVVFVTFQPDELNWLCVDKNKQVIKILDDPRFQPDNLYNLTVCQ